MGRNQIPVLYITLSNMVICNIIQTDMCRRYQISFYTNIFTHLLSFHSLYLSEIGVIHHIIFISLILFATSPSFCLKNRFYLSIIDEIINEVFSESHCSICLYSLSFSQDNTLVISRHSEQACLQGGTVPLQQHSVQHHPQHQ